MNNKQGFSIVELMIAIVILVVLVLGSAAVVYQAAGGIQRQQNKREATVLADQLMDEFWSKSYTNLRDVFGGGSLARTLTVNGRSMPVSITISTEQKDADLKSYIELTIEVDYRGSSEDIVLVTRRYEYGINKAAL